MKRILRDYPEISIKSESLDGKIDFAVFFGRSGPVHIEIGSGKGAFLLNQAQVEPDINFLGIERANKYYRYAVDRIGRWGLKNVRLIRTEAADFIAGKLPANSVDCFHIYFPDPWPKKRHHKRRFLNQVNFGLLLRALKIGGVIQIVSDHEDYFQQITAVVKQNSDLLEEIDFIAAVGADKGEITGTNYERKYLKKNKQVFKMAVKKTKNPL
jgi:tRNA (guanine-N7-)-methyltransferase